MDCQELADVGKRKENFLKHLDRRLKKKLDYRLDVGSDRRYGQAGRTHISRKHLPTGLQVHSCLLDYFILWHHTGSSHWYR